MGEVGDRDRGSGCRAAKVAGESGMLGGKCDCSLKGTKELDCDVSNEDGMGIGEAGDPASEKSESFTQLARNGGLSNDGDNSTRADVYMLMGDAGGIS